MDLPAEEPLETEIVQDEAAMQNLIDAGLIDENGEFNEEAYMALPEAGISSIGSRSLQDPNNDRRTPVSNTGTSPYKFVTKLVLKYGNQYLRGTGVIVGHNAVATAAHNLYGRTRGKVSYLTECDSVTIYTTANKAFAASKGTYDFSASWKSSGGASNDYAIIPANGVSTNIGICGIKAASTNIVGSSITIPGYPSYYKGSGNSIMLTHNGSVARQSGSMLYYTIDTDDGNSGSPIFQGTMLCGIHAYGHNSSRENSGRRVEGDLRTKINKYR